MQSHFSYPVPWRTAMDNAATLTGSPIGSVVWGTAPYFESTVAFTQDPGGPWIPIGAAVNSGRTYVGNVGGHGVVDFTALGDSVNTAARLASSAGAGEALLSETVYAAVAGRFPNLEQRSLALRGKEAPFAVRVCTPARPG